MDKTKKILARARRVAPLPQSVVRLMQLMNDKDHSAVDVARAISTDPALTANVIRVVNSVSFSLNEKVTTVDRAVAYLGDKLVMGIAIGSGANEIYGNALEGYAGMSGSLWKHSLCTAIAARELALFATQPVNPGVAYTVGIMHDIGKSILSEFLREEAGPNYENMLLEKDFLKIERDRVGTDHAEVGAAIAVQWKLPKEFTEVIRYHHEPALADPEYRALAYVVHAGDFISAIVGQGTGLDSFQYVLDPGYSRYLAISEETIDRMIVKVSGEFESVRASLFS